MIRLAQIQGNFLPLTWIKRSSGKLRCWDRLCWLGENWQSWEKIAKKLNGAGGSATPVGLPCATKGGEPPAPAPGREG